MFSISFTDDPEEYPFDDGRIPAQAGRLVLGNVIEGFSANLGLWDRKMYEDHWRRELTALAQGQIKAALIVSYDDPEHSSNAEIWAFYREGEVVIVQNHLLFYAQQAEGWTTETASQHLKNRQQSDSGNPISEWTVSDRDIYMFLRRATGRLISSIP